MARKGSKLGWFAALLGMNLVLPNSARANGAFPEVSQLVSDPSNAAHLVLRSNFGLLTTLDGGSTWDLICEAGVGYQNIEPPIAVLESGTTIAALPNGIARGAANGCEFSLATGAASYVADVARVPGSPRQAVAVSVDFDRSESQVWRTLDDGATWSTWGAALEDLNAATLDVASSTADVLYVSGISQSEGVQGVLARSDDGGQTWTRCDVPGVSKVSAPYIAAVAQGDADTVFVRLSGAPGHLLATRDGGSHFERVLDFQGPFDGFALSPDGRYALASGRVDGVWRAPTTTLAFERLSCARLRCLSWSSAGLFACADEFQAGFVVGQSNDSGLSFEARLHLSCVRGPLVCPEQSAVAQACSAAWPSISEQLGTDCAGSNYTPNNACADAGSSGEDTAVSGAAGSTLRPEGGAAGERVQPSGGCSLSGSSDVQRAPSAWLSGLTALCWLARRRRLTL